MDRFFETVGSRLGEIADNVAAAVTHVEGSFRDQRHRQNRNRQQEATADGGRQRRQQRPSEMRPTPPASNRAIRRLPTIRIAPEDLVDPCNRECCICLEQNNLNDLVTRMPCAHIFHSNCLRNWLSKHRCTCPICRYELETDDPSYEVERMQRMKSRKPRFAMYELKRLPIAHLKSLCRSASVSGVEKPDLIQLLIDKQWVELVPAPEPVRYELSTLKRMGISKLKRTMEDAGVFFRREDIVEKNDMIILFQNSGRLELIEEETEPADDDRNYFNGYSNIKSSIPTQPTVSMTDGETGTCYHGNSRRRQSTMVETVYSIDPNGSRNQHQSFAYGNHPSSCIVPLSVRETARPEEEDVVADETSDEESILPGLPRNIEVFNDTDSFNAMSVDESLLTDTHTTASSWIHESSLQGQRSLPDPGLEPLVHARDDRRMNTRQGGRTLNFSHDENNEYDGGVEPMDEASEYVEVHRIPVESSENTDNNNNSNEDGAAGNTNSNENWIVSHGDHAQYASFSIGDLSEIARAYNVDISGCFERGDIVRLLIEAQADPHASRGTTGLDALDTWTVSQLRALANEVYIDLSHCRDRESMVNKIVSEATHGNKVHLLPYLKTLAPVATMSLSQLRSTARQCQVCISDCIEKGEIIDRLIQTIKQEHAVQ